MNLIDAFMISATIFFVLTSVIIVIVFYQVIKMAKAVTELKLEIKNLVSTISKVKYATQAVVLKKLINLIK